MRKAPKGFRCHVGLFGRRNVGKSSLLNAITRQQVSIVSDFAGTTTDPVEKPMELLPLGPVLFIDTAGIDDLSALGQMRIERTRRVLDRTDLGVIVTDAGDWSGFEEELLGELRRREVPVVVVLNKVDQSEPCPATGDRLSREGIRLVRTVAPSGVGILEFRQALLESAPADFVNHAAIVSDLVGPGELAVLVIPIDKEAPKGRLILAQQQVLRELLDAGAHCVVVTERELRGALEDLRRPPRLVVTDSQAFRQVAADTRPDVPLTSFSILFARFKGDLPEQVRGTLAAGSLRAGDRVLIAEACSHHPIGDDIGRVKIPRWLRQTVGASLRVDVVQGHDFPEDLSPYRLVVHCGACMWNRREMLSRILRCTGQGVPVSNYGLMIAYCLGILERALEPFPSALEAYRRAGELPVPVRSGPA
jgi:[FeFe] hydrogenase H-cluster maturation GTPase HydF